MRSQASLRSRLLAVVLLLASPGAGGMVLPVLHPCPVDQPWAVAAGAMEGHGQTHAHHHGGDGSRPEHRHCQCIGACEDAAMRGAESPLEEFAFLLPVVRVTGADPGSATLAPAPRNLLPPSTAPPQG